MARRVSSKKNAGGDAAKKRRGEGNSGRVANFQESYNKPRHRTPRVETTLENCLGVQKKTPPSFC